MPSLSNSGFISSSAASTASVTSIVFAPYWLAMAMKTPGWPWMSASPNFGSAPSVHRAPRP